MEIELIFKIAAVGIIVSILNQVLSRSGREEQATMTTLAGLVVVLMMVAQKIADLFDLVNRLFHFDGSILTSYGRCLDCCDIGHHTQQTKQGLVTSFNSAGLLPDPYCGDCISKPSDGIYRTSSPAR